MYAYIYHAPTGLVPFVYNTTCNVNYSQSMQTYVHVMVSVPCRNVILLIALYRTYIQVLSICNQYLQHSARFKAY
jgi:hypothetical protein